MKKSKANDVEVPDMLPEYNFRGGIRGRHYKAYRQGHTIKIHKRDGTTSVQHFPPEELAITLDPDVRAFFPDSDAVNHALRALISAMPRPRAETR